VNGGMVRRLLPLFLPLFLMTTTAAAQSPVEAIYEDVHDDVCGEMHVNPCPRLEDPDARWAFVAMWCEQHTAEDRCRQLPDDGPAVIAFHHDAKRWRAVRGVDPDDVELDANGVPKVHTRSGRKVAAVVESTNPLLYVAEAGAITETNSPAVASVQALFDLLGPGIVRLAGQSNDGRLQADELALVTHAEDAIKPLQCIPEQWSRTADFITQLEKQNAAGYALLANRNDCGAISTGTFDAALATLRTSVLPLRGADFCSAGATSFLELFDLDPAKVPALRTKFDAIPLNNNCRNRFRDLRQVTQAALEALEAGTPAALRNWETNARGSQTPLRARLDAAAKAQKLVTAADELLGTKKDDTKKALDQVEQFERRLLANVATTDAKTPASTITQPEVADFLVVQDGMIAVAWEKVRARTLTVKKSSPFSDKVFARRPDSVASSYSGDVRSASLIDMAVAATFTQLSSPVYGAVKEEGTDRTVIAKVDEEERSGMLALFVSYPVYRRVLGVEVGAGTDTENTALFTGLSWRLGGFRLGFGSTWQQVKGLDGQTVGTAVTSKDDIRLKNELASSWYASFSFSLGSLSLFKKP
jgi:transcriptional regulator with XRE-family HTH domain